MREDRADSDMGQELIKIFLMKQSKHRIMQTHYGYVMGFPVCDLKFSLIGFATG